MQHPPSRRRGSDMTPPKDATALLALADRCETEEPNPYLASAILVAAGHQTLFRGEKLGWEWRKDGVGVWSSMPRPDTSLDAAVTLRPEGFRIAHGEEYLIRGDWGWTLKASDALPVDYDAKYAFGIGKTSALALCAAALRARAAVLEASGITPSSTDGGDGGAT